VVSSLGTTSAGPIGALVGELGDIGGTPLYDNKIEARKIVADDATPDGLSLASTVSLGSVLTSGYKG
jgi:hypothetical protein